MKQTDTAGSPVNYNLCKFHHLRLQLATNAQLLPLGQILNANSLNLSGIFSGRPDIPVSTNNLPIITNSAFSAH